MTTESTSIPSQYGTGTTRERIEQALTEAGHSLDSLTPDQLAMLEHFHVSGPLATASLIDLLAVKPEDRVLDAGTGIGGTARYVAQKYGSKVTAIDLTPEYVVAAQWLNELVGLSGLIEVREADVTSLPFADESFDVVVSQHVQMNIADKARLYAEAFRVLAPGGRLGIWDVTAGPVQPVTFPLPWADTEEVSHLVTPDELRESAVGAGFEVEAWNDLTQSNGEFMRAIMAGPPSPLGLGVFVPDFATKLTNLVDAMEQNRTRLIQAVLVKRAAL
jgi:ubiquinone/menaquinone biosynthesis C-methylase UbiE